MPAATTKLQLSNEDKKYLQSFQTIADKLDVTVKTVQL